MKAISSYSLQISSVPGQVLSIPFCGSSEGLEEGQQGDNSPREARIAEKQRHPGLSASACVPFLPGAQLFSTVPPPPQCGNSRLKLWPGLAPDAGKGGKREQREGKGGERIRKRSLAAEKLELGL